MTRRGWSLVALALWLGATLILQSAGVTMLTAHLTAAALAVGVVLTVRLVRRPRT